MADNLTPRQLVDVVRAERRERWSHGDRIRAETFLERFPAVEHDPDSAIELIYHEILLREELGETPQPEEYLARFPQYAARLEPLWEVHRAIEADTPDHLLESGENSVSTPVSSAEPVDESWPTFAEYQVLDRVGQGGMGVLYRAVQRGLNRCVALKLIRSGAEADASELARFRAEAEAQARLQHPHIAQVYEVGESAGWPFFALEYVEGGSLAEKLRAGPFNARAAATMVETLAQAMQHAHEHAVIHRDLKPANVMLTKDGQPKVTDFGLAKRWQDESGQTGTGDLLGTPSYMAPEQTIPPAPGRIGPAVDIYALGAILYELLTGRPPFLAETALDTLLQVRTLDPIPVRRLQPKVPRDLENICLQCLRKEIDKRYATAQELADDLRRFLDGKAVFARPVGIGERTLKWAKRRPAVAALLVALAVVTAGSVVALTRLWLKAEGHRQVAETNLEKSKKAEGRAKAINEFLTTTLLKAPRPKGEGLGRDVTMREALDDAATKIGPLFADQPEAEISVREAIADTYRLLGFFTEAENQLLVARELCRRHLADDNFQTLSVLETLANVYLSLGKNADAESISRQVLKDRERILGPENEFTLNVGDIHATAVFKQGKWREAEAPRREILKSCRRVLGPEHPLTLAAAHNLANLCTNLEKPTEAERLYTEVLNVRRRLLGLEHPYTLTTEQDFATFFLSQARWDDAEKLLLKSLEVQRRVLGPEHPNTLCAEGTLATLLLETGRLKEAEVHCRQVLNVCEKTLGPDHYYTLTSLTVLGQILQNASNAREAEALLVRAVEGRRRVLGEEHPDTLRTVESLATAKIALAKYKEAENLLRPTVEICRRALGPENRLTLGATHALVSALVHLGRREEAIPLQRDVLQASERKWGSNRPDTLIAMNNLGQALILENKLAEAEPLVLELNERLDRLQGARPPTPYALAAKVNLARLRWGQGRLNEAIDLYEATSRRMRQVLPSEHIHLRYCLAELSKLLMKTGAANKAEPSLRECLEISRYRLPHGNPTIIGDTVSLAGCLIHLKEYCEAEALLLNLYGDLEQIKPLPIAALAKTLDSIVQLYEASGSPDTAAEWRAKRDGLAKSKSAAAK